MLDRTADLLDNVAAGISDGFPACEHCGAEYEPRQSTGGKPQRFCSPECRKSFHAAATTPTSAPAPVVPKPVPTPPAVQVILDAIAAKEPPPAADPDFKWSPDNEDIVLPEQRTTAVYLNGWHQVVVRQEKAWDDEDDVYICISLEYLPAVIVRLASLLPDGHSIKRALAK